MNTIIAKNDLKIKRIKSGMSIRHLASKAGVNIATVTRIENYHTNPTPATATKLCNALACSFDDLFMIREA